MSDSVALYYHIPFCKRKCIYCAFYSVPWATEEVKDAYLFALLKQTASFPEPREITSVYFGGGTPNLFGPRRLDKLLSEISKRFHLTEDCEISMELNPGISCFEDLHAYHMAGVNRLSIGMQSSDDDTLTLLGRNHTFLDTVNCMNDARKEGYGNISLDLMFALPGMDCGKFEKTLSDALNLEPEHISAYSLQLEEGTPLFMAKHNYIFPDEDEEEREYQLLCSRTGGAGYRHYEISSFARNDHVSRHNMHYWQCRDYIGFGPAAHSYWNGKRFSNKADIKEYIKEPLISNDYDSAESLSEEEVIEEQIMLGLRTDEGVKASLLSKKKVSILMEKGYLFLNDNRVRITERGWRVSNSIIGFLLA